MTANTDLTVADLAAELGTDPRTARKFLRKVTPKENQPGKGGRWSIARSSLKTLRKGFAEYSTPAVEDASTEE